MHWWNSASVSSHSLDAAEGCHDLGQTEDVVGPELGVHRERRVVGVRLHPLPSLLQGLLGGGEEGKRYTVALGSAPVLDGAKYLQLHRHHGVVGLAGGVGGVVVELAHDLHGLHEGVQSCKRREELLVGEDGGSFLFALNVRLEHHHSGLGHRSGLDEVERGGGLCWSVEIGF